MDHDLDPPLGPDDDGPDHDHDRIDDHGPHGVPDSPPVGLDPVEVDPIVDDPLDVDPDPRPDPDLPDADRPGGPAGGPHPGGPRPVGHGRPDGGDADLDGAPEPAAPSSRPPTPGTSTVPHDPDAPPVVELGGPDDPVELDAPAHAVGGFGDGPDTPVGEEDDPVNLDLGDTDLDGETRTPDGDDALDGDEPEDLLLPLEGDDVGAPFAPAPDNGWLTPALLLSASSAAAAAIVVPLSRRERLTSRRAAASLEQHGVDARVEHGSVEALAEWLRTPGEEVNVAIHLAGRDALVCSVVRVDPDAGSVEVEEPGPMGMRLDVRLDEFERAWADTAHEVLVTATGDRVVRVLPVTLDDRSLVTPGW